MKDCPIKVKDIVIYTGKQFNLSPDLKGKLGVVNKLKLEFDTYLGGDEWMATVYFDTNDLGYTDRRTVFAGNVEVFTHSEHEWEV